MIEIFRIKEVIFNRKWLPLCIYRRKELPFNTCFERYRRLIRTKGLLVEKESIRLKFKDKIIFNNWKFPFKPEKYKIDNNILYIRIPSSYISISFIKFNNRIETIVLKKNFKLDHKDLIAIGLLKGEMISSLRGKSKEYICFCNSNVSFTRIVIRLLEKLGISKNSISFQILVNTYNGEKYRDEKYIEYWSKSLSVSKKKFVKNYYNNKNRTKNLYGSISIKYYNKYFRLFLQFLVNYVIDKANKLESKYILMGIIAAEGNVNLSPNNSLNFVCIGGSENYSTKQYTKLLKRIGIDSGSVIKSVSNDYAKKRGWKKGTGGFMMIQGWKNFKIIYLERLMDIEQYKLLQFLYGLRNHEYAKRSKIYNKIQKDFKKIKMKQINLYKLLDNKRKRITDKEKRVIDLMKQYDYMTTSDLSKKLNILRSSASRILNSIYRKNKIKKIKKGFRVYWKL